MAQNLRRLCCICARAGSKGLPNKNLLPLAGKPLLAYSIEQAKTSGLFDVVAVSSDGGKILDVAAAFGADELVERPAELASDAAPKLPAIRHCVEVVEQRVGISFGVIADLAVTSPLRALEDIKGAIALLETDNVPLVLSASKAVDSPYFNIVEVDADGGLALSKPLPASVLRRQDAPQCYALNGAVYVWRRAALFVPSDTVVRPEARLYIMPEERSIDLDNAFDFRLAETLIGGEKPVAGFLV